MEWERKKLTTTTKSKETNKFATFDTAADRVAAAGPVEGAVTGGSGGSTTSPASNGGNGGSVGGLASEGTILMSKPISGGKIIYGATLRLG